MLSDEEIYDLWAETKPPMFINFARAIEQKVREECAVICEERWYPAPAIALDCAEAIRARGKE